MRVLFIGGSGTISAAISRRVLDLGWELYLLNRGNRNSVIKTPCSSVVEYSSRTAPGKLVEIPCDIRTESAEEVRRKAKAALGENKRFDVVAEFFAFTTGHVEKDYAAFKDICDQYIFISSASAYQKPPSSCLITESTPLANPFWQYSRDKIACEEFLLAKYRENGFPVTIVRPSHTYDERNVPMGVHGKNGSWQVVKRLLNGKPVIIHGDGTSLWTMTHNSDFALGFTGLMGNIHAIGEAVHITSDESLTWNQIFGAIANALGVPLNAVHVASEFLARRGPGYDFTGSLIGDKANSVIFDNTKLKRLVPGFCAKVRFDQGIRETVAYVLSHKECQTDDPEFDEWSDKIIAAQTAVI